MKNIGCFIDIPGKKHKKKPRARHGDNQDGILGVTIGSETAWYAGKNEQIANDEDQFCRLVRLKFKSFYQIILLKRQKERVVTNDHRHGLCYQKFCY